MADEIIIKYKADVSGLTADLKTVQTDLKATETVATDSANKTTKAFDKTTDSTKSLKAQLSELNKQLQKATDPKDVEKLARDVGKLKDQISSAAAAANVFATSSKFEQIGNAFGSVVSKLRNLDFSGAVAQSKLLVATSKSLTFKEALGGVKDLGTTLLNVGKSLLLNPIFLIGAAVTGIIANFDKLKNSGGIVGKVFGAIGDAISFTVNAIEDFANAIGLIDSTTGKFFDNLTEKSLKAAKQNEERLDYEIRLRQAAGKETVAQEILKQKAIINTANLEFNLIKQRIKATGEFTDEQKARITELGGVIRKANEDIAIIEAKANADKLKKQAELNKQLEDEADKFAKVLRDLQTQNIELDYERRKQIILNNFDDETAKYKGHLDIINELVKKKNNDLNDLEREKWAKNQQILTEAQDDYIKKYKEGVKDIEGADVGLSAKVAKNIQTNIDKEKLADEQRRARLTAFVNFAQQALSTYQQLYNDNVNAQIQANNDAKDENLAALQEEYDNKLISQEIYESRKKKIQDEANAVERELKKEQFERNKQLALINATIATAQAISGALAQTAELGYGAIILAGLMAVLGAAQIGAIASQPTPKFEKGGRIGGKRHSQGGTLIEAEVDEFVVNRKDAIKHYDLVDAINSGNAEDYINKQYIAPILKEQQKKFREQKENSFADSIVNSMMLNSGQFKDGNLLEALKRNRQSDRENTMILVKELSKRTHNSRSW